jgi:hypothetical protein
MEVVMKKAWLGVDVGKEFTRVLFRTPLLKKLQVSLALVDDIKVRMSDSSRVEQGLAQEEVRAVLSTKAKVRNPAG